MARVKIEDDFTQEEIDLANRINDMASTVDDISDLQAESRELVNLGVLTSDQVDRATRNLNEATALSAVLERRLAKMIERRRQEA